MSTTPRHVLIVMPQRTHILDVAGPAQAFVNANKHSANYRVSYVSDADVVRTHQGIDLSASTVFPDLLPTDLVLIAGWETSTSPHPLSADLRRSVRQHWDSGGHVASVCAGALLLADLGILDGQDATTHHDLIKRLSSYRRLRIYDDVLYTCNPRVHTSAGIASGIDLSLHLIAHDHGPAVAAKVARSLVVPAWRPGATSQVSVLVAYRNHMDDLCHRAQDLIGDPHYYGKSLDQIAGMLAVSGRTLARHFSATLGLTPHQYMTKVRREQSDQLIAQGWSRQEAAQAVGYADARSLRQRNS